MREETRGDPRRRPGREDGNVKGRKAVEVCKRALTDFTITDLLWSELEVGKGAGGRA